MATSIARVGSVALTELKADLTCLSKTLHQIYELMNADMRQVNAAWQDGKYQEFVQNYQPQIQKCEEISNRYADWCARVLDPTIENVVSVERTDVGGGGGSVGGVSPAGMAGGAAAVTAVSGAGVAGGFNLGTGMMPKATTKAVPISNGCGSENSLGSQIGARLAKPKDAEATGTSIEFQNESCDQHDKDYFNGIPQEQADREFEQRSPIMGAAVRGDLGTAYDRFFGKKDTKIGSKIGSMFNEGVKETARESYANAQRDREISQRLQSTWENEHQQSLDAENYRIDVEEGGSSIF